jgi:hypothetical protein
MDALGQARTELAGAGDEKRCGVLFAFLDLQMALAMKALSTYREDARILRLRPSGDGR